MFASNASSSTKLRLCPCDWPPPALRLPARWLLFRGRRVVLLQQLLDMHKHLQGPPKGGSVSIVVTDIEGFSGGGFLEGASRASSLGRSVKLKVA